MSVVILLLWRPVKLLEAARSPSEQLPKQASTVRARHVASPAFLGHPRLRILSCSSSFTCECRSKGIDELRLRNHGPRHHNPQKGGETRYFPHVRPLFCLCVVSRERNRKARSVAEIDGSWPSATATLSVRAVRFLNPLRFRHHDPDLKPAARAPRTRQHMTGFARNWGPRERKWVYSSYDDLIFEQASPGPARALRFEF